MQSLTGQLLVASPHLLNSPFTRTVVLILQHDEEGTFGVVLNRPSNQSVKRFWQSLSSSPCLADGVLNFGGPVSGPVVALHGEEQLAEATVAPDVYVAASEDDLSELVGHHDRIRLFVGHAGWAPEQLERELDSGAWLLLPASADYVFGDPEHLWNVALRDYGRTFFERVLNIRHVPPDPSYN